MSKTYEIAVLPGDGIGPEIMESTLKVLEALVSVEKFKLNFLFGEAGDNCLIKYGTNMPKKTLDMMKKTKACLKGPMTTSVEPKAPPSAAVTIRKTFSLYSNIRPCKTLVTIPSLKPNIDLIIVRENTEGLYSGIEFEVGSGKGVALRVITSKASAKVGRSAFKIAEKRRRLVTCVHKRNILRVTGGIFRNTVFNISKEFPSVTLEEAHIDAMAMRLIKEPEKFDVIVTTNLFGDVLSDEAAQLVGGLGLVAGANIGDAYGMFEPVHGSAPKYAGKNKVNPIAQIHAAKMMIEYLNEIDASLLLGKAVEEVLKEGKEKTYDLGGKSTTKEMSEAIAKKILKIAT
jgi:isopropylmalate/isohomocitrate dehydrogenase-like protein